MSIIWDGKNSDSYGIIVTKYPDYKKPTRKTDVYSVPGRNGDIIMQQDAWENVNQPYEIATNGNGGTAADSSNVSEWLFSADGYCRLSDSFDTTHFRLAYCSNGYDVENLMGVMGRAKIVFDCKPQRFLITGETPVTISTSGQTINNPTEFNARPLLKVIGGGSSGTLTINGTVFTISNTSAPIFIDCEEMDCYDANGDNKNSIVSSSNSEFATIAPGSNTIGFTGGITSVVITPRWWEL